ncbi:hypothetical protein J8L85_16860, partial [Maribacter sp. MMG018]|uniref:hypothetical protein n=1 Tax=Maribacter sp. MMG018 TaxID=2822688 RepID=UPI001B39730E
GDDDTQLTDAQVATAMNNEFPNLDTDSTDDFDGEWTSLNNIPADIADGDDDTQLTEAEVATAVNNQFPNLDTDATDDFSGSFNDLSNVPANLDTDSTDDFDGEWTSLNNIPADIADGDDDTQLTDAQVATAVNNQFPNLDIDSTDDFDGEWTSLNNVPADIADGDDQQVELFAFNGSTYELLLGLENDATTRVANLSSLHADGTETKITAGSGILITGDGSSSLPYNIINDFTEVDGSITNEVNTAFSTVTVSGTEYLRISDSNGDLDVPLSDLSHSGTTGSIFFAGSDGKPTENNSQLFWDTSNNRLSIGNPLSGTNKLTVNGATRTSGLNNSDGTTGQPSYRFSDDSNTGMYSPNNDEIGFSVGGTEALKMEENSGTTSVIVNETLELEGAVLDSSNSPGTTGQVLSSTATGTAWVDSYNPVKAIGKIASNGTVTRATPGVTVTRLSTGYYRVTLPAGAVSDADYIIQLTQPGRGGAGNDDPGISYSNQTATSFEVIIGDNDNGATDRSRFDSEFMFTILDL